jgi:hypothetical protein
MPSIEGEAIRVVAQKIAARKPIKIGGVTFYPFNARTSANGTIERQYADMQGKPQYVRGANLSQGNNIQGNKVSVCSSTFSKCAKCDGQSGGRSGAHTRQHQLFHGVAFAVVFQGFAMNDLIRGDPWHILEAAHSIHSAPEPT